MYPEVVKKIFIAINSRISNILLIAKFKIIFTKILITLGLLRTKLSHITYFIYL